MASWGEFVRADPSFGALAVARIDGEGLVMVGTLRRNGWPRISPVEPLIVGGELCLGMMWRSRKAVDLLGVEGDLDIAPFGVRDDAAIEEGFTQQKRHRLEHLVYDVLVQIVVVGCVELIEQRIEAALIGEPNEQQNRDRPAA